jgi:arginyl-tRNA synthetase
MSSQVKELTEKGLVEESEGARVIHCGKAFPLMPVKSDGGYLSYNMI